MAASNASPVQRFTSVAFEGRLAIVAAQGSCAPDHLDAFPPDVAVEFPDTRNFEGWLIKPDADWLFGSWDRALARQRNLCLDYLWRYGRPRAEVAAQLANALASRRVLSCDPGSDRYWLERVFGRPLTPLEAFEDHLRGRAGNEGRQAAAAEFTHLTVEHGPDVQGRAAAAVVRGLFLFAAVRAREAGAR